jgi:transposase
MINWKKSIIQGEGNMTESERWNMYLEIKQLKEIGLNVSQIARKLKISRNTVYKYMDLNPQEINDLIEESKTRQKKLDGYYDEILSWLKEYPDLSSAQVLDWLLEKYGDIPVCEGTVRNFVNKLRKEHAIPKLIHKRHYEAIEDPPMGQQMQVDFGEKKLLDCDGSLTKLWFIAFVLSNSRYKYVEWLDRPFTTADVIRTHENAFGYFGGMPEEIVYDQDHLILVSENHGDLILTHEFTAYREKRRFKIYMCKKQDPESKGRIEKVVDFVKINFARNRTFYNLDKLNEECLSWLKRTGNGKMHNTTKKIPAEVFLIEKHYLKPVENKITIKSTCTSSISRLVLKDNTVRYAGNRYTLPLGTYDVTGKYVGIHVTNDKMLVIYDQETGEELARHHLSDGKGELIKNNNHKRDRTKGIDSYLKQVAELLNNTPDAKAFLDEIHKRKPRYIRDQLQLIKRSIPDVDKKIIEDALKYCIKYSLYSATDFADVIKHYQEIKNSNLN